jgi:ribonuclease E
MRAPEPAPVAETPPPAPRRRSTVREAAPVFDMASDAPAYTPPAPPPVPAPAEPAAAEAEPDKPRRFGWWSKKG